MGYSEIPYSVEDFLDRFYTGERIIHRGGEEAYVDCFYCNCKARKRKSSIVLYGEKAHLFSCLSCGTTANTRKIIRDITGGDVSADKIMLGDSYKEIRASYKAKYREEKPNLRLSTLSSINDRDLVNNVILSKLSLSEEDLYKDEKSLIKRGFEMSDVQRLGYKTVDIHSEEEADKLSQIILNSCEKKGLKVKGVMGFYEGDDGKYRFCFPNRPAILVPYRNRNNKIHAFQIRLRKPFGKMRYYWLSSSEKKNGCGEGNFVHYATDFVFDFVRNEEIAIIGDTLFITEGALKGDLAHKYMKAPFLCVAGVNSIGHIKDELLSYKTTVKHVICAYDMDYLSNEKVQKAEKKLEDTIKECGFEYHRLVWDSNYKGIDDFVVGVNGKFYFEFASKDGKYIMAKRKDSN